MPKQEFTAADYLGVVAVWCIFFAMLGFITITCINFCCIHENDDVTVLEKWGHKRRLGVRLGVHKRLVISNAVEMHKFRSDN